MKTLAKLSFLLLTVAFLSSCDKEELPSPSPIVNNNSVSKTSAGLFDGNARKLNEGDAQKTQEISQEDSHIRDYVGGGSKKDNDQKAHPRICVD